MRTALLGLSAVVGAVPHVPSAVQVAAAVGPIAYVVMFALERLELLRPRPAAIGPVCDGEDGGYGGGLQLYARTLCPWREENTIP